MAIKGITKNSISADIGAEHFAALFESIYGKSGICNIYQKLLCTKIDNNTVRLSSGVYSLSGYMVMVENGTSEDFVIDSGTAGLKRNDLLVAEFVRNGLGSGIDILTFRIIKGTSVVGTASDPALIAQTISAEGVTRQEALYRIMIDGTNITSVVPVAVSIQNIRSIESELSFFQRPRTMLYPSSDERWRSIEGVGFYYAGETGLTEGYPSTFGFMMQMKLSGGSVVFQMFLGGTGNLWTRRVTISDTFAGVLWVKI